MGTNIYARLHPDNQERKKLALKIKDAIMTNEPDMYYQIENILEEHKEKYPVIHLGKRSYGWKFLWAPNPKYYCDNKRSIDLFLRREDVLLYNEYGGDYYENSRGYHICLTTRDLSDYSY